MPPGLARLAWRAGGVWVTAREVLMPRLARPRGAVRRGRRSRGLGGLAAAWVGHAAESQFHVIATVLLLAGLPLLARRFFGPASPSRACRFLRVFCCAAILAYMPALYIVNAFANRTPAQPAFQRIVCPDQNCGGAPDTSTGARPGRARSRSC